ncbi:MAG TPA: ATP-binding protein [Candidatus Binatia bacterium]|nr:ATP-binding protein [Candidatus Binatia bacterium]
MIIMFCGIPGSGKTTIAELLAARLGDLGRVQLLSSDKLKAPVYRKMLKTLGPDQKRAEFVILDATFYKKAWREQVEALAHDEKVITVHLECALDIALERNRKRRPNISEKALHVVFHRMEPPDRPTLKIDTANLPASDAAAKIFDHVKEQR